MVKAYLRYAPGAAFGVVTSGAAVAPGDAAGRLLLTPALESVAVWNARLASPTTTFAAAAKPERAASRRLIRVWDFVGGACEVTLAGHRGAVSALRYDAGGALLASGGADTDVVVWDAAGEAGLFRLRGHRGQVTDVAFVELPAGGGGGGARWLATTAKDGLVRVWDLDTQRCVQVVAGHRGEVWSLDPHPRLPRLVTAAADRDLRLYAVAGDGDREGGGGDVLTLLGTVRRQSNDRAVAVRFSDDGRLLAVLAAGKTIELYRHAHYDTALCRQLPSPELAEQPRGALLKTVLGDKEAARKAKRRKKRRREKDRAAAPHVADDEGGGGGDEDAAGEGRPAGTGTVVAADELALLQVVRLKYKVRSFCFLPAGAARKGVEAVMAVALSTNCLQTVEVKDTSATVALTVELPGHRSGVRASALSSDASMLLSTSHDAVKLWNPRTGVCLRSMEAGYGLCGLFAPGDRHVIVGTKSGALEIFSIDSSSRIESVDAHSGALWSIAARPDGSGFATASADHDVKFWDYELRQGTALEEDSAAGPPPKQRLGVVHVTTLRMHDDVLCVRFSPDGKYVAVALLDFTVKVYFVDSLKFFLSLYGHKLPVLCMDISSDSSLLATGSADKNVKLWGLDFGDCHKSLFAHADRQDGIPSRTQIMEFKLYIHIGDPFCEGFPVPCSVMQVQFVPNTHYFFTTGKDRLIKYWDGDKFEHLLTLEGHHAEVWSLTISSHGEFFVSTSHDRSIRRWDRTEEPFFVEEEREKRLESMFEETLESEPLAAEQQEAPADGAVGPAGRQTQDTVTAADNIIAALDLANVEIERVFLLQAQKKTAPENVLMLGQSPTLYVLGVLSKVRTSDLEQALVMLPFSDVLKLLGFLEQWLSEGSQIELTVRVAVLLLRMHHNQLVATPSARGSLTSLHGHLRTRVQDLKHCMGFNLAAMAHLQHVLDVRSSDPVSDAAAKVLEIRAKLAKGREKIVAEKMQEHRKKRKRRTP
eukprot:SM000084S23098  [mRNA]  locus=s84:136275:141241:+ [translate_table: standard]